MKLKKKYLTSLLTGLLIIQNIPVNTIIAEDTDPEDHLVITSTNFTTETSGGEFSDGNKLPYGSNLGIARENDTEYYYTSINNFKDNGYGVDNQWQDLSSDSKLTPGKYFLYSVRGSSDITSAGEDYIFNRYGVEITRAEVSTVKGTWEGTKPTFSLITTSKAIENGATSSVPLDEGAISNDYKIQLYKNGVKHGEQVSYSDTLDFASTFKSGESGGAYTFEVIPTILLDDFYVQNNENVKSDPFNVYYLVNNVEDDGTNITFKENRYLYNVEGNKTLEFDITLSAGYILESVNASGLNIVKKGDTENTYTATLDGTPDNYDIEIVVNAKDNTNPTIEKFEPNTENSAFVIKASDVGSGVLAYSISKQNELSAEDSSWINYSGDEININPSTSDMESGEYHLFIKDRYNNITKSGSTIKLTKITYQDDYDGSQLTNTVVYYVGQNENYVLKADPNRPGFTLYGWYIGESKQESLNVNGEDINVVARYSPKPIDISNVKINNTEQSSFSKTYDGQGVTIEPVHDITDSRVNIAYEWFKYNDTTPEKLTNTSSILTLKDVQDSGKYKVVVKASADNYNAEKEFDNIDITINKKEVTVKPKPTSVSFLTAPTFDYTAEIIDGDKDSVGTATYTVKNSSNQTVTDLSNLDAGEYTIEIAGLSNENYDFIYATNKLTVTPKNVNLEDSKVSIQIKDQATYIYNGTEYTPEVLVKDDNQEIDSSNYTVSYENNINATATDSKAIIKVAFKGNYQGEITETFDIVKRQLNNVTVNLEGWVYDAIAHKPTLNNNDSTGRIYYTYYKKGNSTPLEKAPVDVGEYKIKATIEATDNDQEIITPELEYAITQKEITITSGSYTWQYDGNEHKLDEYTISPTNAFVGNDGIKAVTFTGKITNVSENRSNNNTFTVTLNDIAETHKNNYKFNYVYGTLKIEEQTLNAPGQALWMDDGVARWTAISKNYLSVDYEVKLFAGSKESPIKTDTTTALTYDFKKDILNYLNNNDLTNFYFTVKARPLANNNESANDNEKISHQNYLESSTASQSSNLYLAQIVVEQSDKGEGIESVTSNGKSLLEDKVFAFSDSTVEISAVTTAAYGIDTNGWQKKNERDEFTINQQGGTNTSITISNLTESKIYKLKVTASDLAPEIANFSYSISQNKVTFNLKAQDAGKIVGWIITKSDEETSSETLEWNTVDSSSIDVSSFEVTSFDEIGTYRAYVKDNAGNVSQSLNSLNVYGITFSKNGNSEEGSMNYLLKIENEAVELSVNQFTKVGYEFKDWVGNDTKNTHYSDGSSYGLNANVILKPTWLAKNYSYTINYYYEKANEEGYDQETENYTAPFGSKVEFEANSKYDKLKRGFTLEADNTNNKYIIDSIQTDNNVLNIYYKRNRYTLTYQYNNVEGNTQTLPTVELKYGQTLPTSPEYPVSDGYSFVGWEYGETGTKPETMPNNNITATGYFVGISGTYDINYYFETLNDGSYVKDETKSQSISIHHHDLINILRNDAETVDGFTLEGYTLTKGTTQGGTIIKEDTNDYIVSALDSDHLTVNYYFKRNTYSITLNIYKDSNYSNVIFTQVWSPIKYGYQFNQSDESIYTQTDNLNYWFNNRKNPTDEGYIDFETAGYKLTDYIDWSTGTFPTTMPASNVTVRREFVNSEQPYKVNVYLGDQNRDYTFNRTIQYYGSYNSTITVDNAGESNDKHINFVNDLNNAIDLISFYEVDETKTSINNEETTVGTNTLFIPPAKEAGKKKTEYVLNLYLKRKQTDVTVNYFICNANGEKIGEAFASETITSDHWGNTYTVDPLGNRLNEAAKLLGQTNTDRVLVSYWTRYRISEYGNGYKRVLQEQTITSTLGVYPYSENSANKNILEVYYTVIPEKQTKYINLKITSSLKKDVYSTARPVKLTIGNESYVVRITNPSYVFEKDAIVQDATVYAYPGLKYLNEKSAYKKENDEYVLKSGFTKVTTEEGYIGYTKEETVDGEQIKYIYMLTDESTDHLLVDGNTVSYTLDLKNSGEEKNIATKAIDQLIDKYKQEHGDPNNAGAYDEHFNAVSVNGRHTNNNSYVNTLIKTSDVSFDLTYNLLYIYTYTTFSINSRSGYVSHYKGDTVILENDIKTNAISGNLLGQISKPGYTFGWYEDSAHNTRAQEQYVLNESRTFYGLIEIKNVTGQKVYNYYELPFDVTLNDDTKINYINKTLIDSAENVVLKDNTTLANHITYDSQNREYIYKENTTDEGVKFASVIEFSHDALSDVYLHEVSTEYNTQDDYINANKPTGFAYDEKNTKNILKAYCLDNPIVLEVYYNRIQHIIEKVSADKTVEVTTAKYGETVHLNKVSKEPDYGFGNWKFENLNNESVEINDITVNQVSDTDNTFVMPNCDVRVTPVYTIQYKQPVVAFFETVNRTYLKDLYESIGENSGTTISFKYNDEIVTGKYYEIGVIEDEVIVGDDKVVRYFDVRNKSKVNDCYNLTASNVFAVKRLATVNHEGENNLSDFIINVPQTLNYNRGTSQIFEFYKAKINNTEEITNHLNFDGVFILNHGTTIEEYYEREKDLSLTLISKSTNGKDNMVILTGGGNDHLFGEFITIKAAPEIGYSFDGWYYKEDVITKDDNGKETFDIAGETKVSSEAITTIELMSSLDLVAVIKPEPVVQPNLEIIGNKEYTYGYTTSSNSVLTTQVTLDEHTKDVTSIYSYSWSKFDESTNQWTTLSEKSQSYLFPSGQEAGEYKYKCEVTLIRNDNGESEAFSIETTVKVNPYTLTINNLPVETTYNGTQQLLTRDVFKNDGLAQEWDNQTNSGDYEISYYLDAEKTQPITSLKDVKVDEEGNVDAYTIYVKATSKNSNYANGEDSFTYKINPKVVSVISKNTYVEQYHGNTTLTGTLELGNHYDLYGITDSDVGKYDITYAGEFNNENVIGATQVNISNVAIVDSEGYASNNYVLKDSNATISGAIRPHEINAQWILGDNGTNNEGVFEYTYNGLAQGPELQYSVDDLPQKNIQIKVEGKQKSHGDYQVTAIIQPGNGYSTTNYAFSQETQNFKINPKQITLTASSFEKAYDGETIDKPTIIDLPSGALATGDKLTYTVARDTNDGDGISVGEYANKITSWKILDSENKDISADYEVTLANGNLKITPRLLTSDKINLSFGTNVPNSYEYAKTEYRPQIIVNDTDLGLLIENTHYIVEYSNNINAGTATVKITGTGNYAAEKTIDFTITKKPLTINATDQAINYGDNVPTWTYTSDGLIGGDVINETSVVYTVKKDEQVIEQNNRIDAGTYTINATGLANNNYEFSYNPGTLTVNRRSIGENNNKQSYIEYTTSSESFKYDATPKTFSSIVITESLDSSEAKSLTLGIDYTVSYSENIKATGTTSNPNKAIAKITGIGNYTGSFDIPFDIAKRTITIKPENINVTYDGFEHKSLKGEVVSGGDGIPQGHTLSITLETNGVINHTTEPVTSTIVDNTIVIKDNNENVTDNYLIEKQTGTITINKAKLNTDDVVVEDITDQIYTSNPIIPSVVVKTKNGHILTQGTDYDVVLKNQEDDNVNVTKDERVVTVTIQRHSNNDNFEGATIDKTFKIIPRDVTLKIKDKEKTYDGQALSYDDTNDYEFTNSSIGDKDNFEVTISGSITNVSESPFTSNVILDNITVTRKENTTKAPSDNDVKSNYTFVIEQGKLTINRKEVTINATISGGTDDKFVYGNLPTMSYTTNGWISGDDVDTNGNITDDEIKNKLKMNASATSPAGTYKVYFDSPITEKGNYKFTYVEKSFEVIKNKIKVDNIAFNNKVYDGKTSVTYTDNSAKLYKNINNGYEVISGDSSIGIDTVSTQSNSHFDDKNVGDSKTISVNISLNQYTAERYELDNDNSQKTATANITKRDLTLPVKNETVKYGDSKPTYSIDKSKITGFVEGENDSVLDFNKVKYTCDYSTKSNVSSEGYIIAATGDDISSNYQPTYTPGKVVVNKATFPVTESITWNDGTFSWKKIDDISTTKVVSYTLNLYKDGVQIETISHTNLNDLKEDLKNKIQNCGEGKYQVGIVGVSSNASNVDNSPEVKSDNIYCAKINLKAEYYKANGTKYSTLDNEKHFINSDETSTSICLISGSEGTFNLELPYINEYDVNILGNDNLELKVNGNTISDNDVLNEQQDNNKGKYTISFKLKEDSTCSSEINVTFKVKNKAATLVLNDFVIDRAVDSEGFLATRFYYGDKPIDNSVKNYQPTFTENCSQDTNDVATKPYTYTYKWIVKRADTNIKQQWSEIQSSNSYKLKPGLSVTEYKIECTVTATRANGEIIAGTKTDSFKIGKVREGDYTVDLKINNSDNYSYYFGETRPTYVASSNKPGENGSPTSKTEELATFEYKLQTADNQSWTTGKPSEAGEYYVRALIPGDQDFDQKYTNNKTVTINKKELTDPTGVNYSLGVLKWTKTPEIVENNGQGTAKVSVNEYEITLARKIGNVEDDDYHKTVTVSGDLNEIDISSLIDKAGVYQVAIKAKVNSNPADRNGLDSPGSPQLTFEASGINVKYNISVKNGDSELTDQYSHEKVYDGKAYKLSIVTDENGLSYQWYKDGELISGATSKEYSIENITVNNNNEVVEHIYTCIVTKGEQSYLTVNKGITIKRRDIKLSLDNKEKTYDGLVLTSNEYTDIKEDKYLGVVDGQYANVTCTDDSKITDVLYAGGVVTTKANKIQDVVITKDSENVTNNYNIVKVAGTLKINPRTLTLNTADANNAMVTISDISETYSDSQRTPKPTVTASYNDINNTAKKPILVENKDFNFSYSENVNAGNNVGTVIITGQGNYTGSVTFNFNIAKRKVILTASSANKVYDKNPLTCSDHSASQQNGNDGLLTTHRSVVVMTTDSTITVVGSKENVIDNNNIHIYKCEENHTHDSNCDVTTNYDIKTEKGTLTVTKASSDNPTVTSYNQPYDGKPHGINVVVGSNLTGTTTVYYKAGNDPITQEEVSAKIGGTDNGLTEENPQYTDYTATAQTVQYYIYNHNYEDKWGSATVNIRKRAITVTADSESRMYDGTEWSKNSYQITTGSLVDGQNSTATVNGSIENVGSVDNTISNVKIYKCSHTDAQSHDNGCDVTNNYDITPVNGKLTVSKRPITISSKSQTWTYNGQEHSDNGYTVTSNTKVANNQKETVTITAKITDVGTIANAIDGVIIKKDDTNGTVVTENYDITKKPGTLIVEEKSLSGDNVTLTLDQSVYTYGADQKTPTVTVHDVARNVNLEKDKDYTVEYINNVNASQNNNANATVKITGIGNYKDQNSINFTINKKDLMVKVKDKTKPYDGTSLTCTEVDTQTGLIDGHAITLTTNGSATNVSEGTVTNEIKNVVVKDTNNNNIVTSNYNISTQTGTLSITPRDLSDTSGKKYYIKVADISSRVYDATEYSPSLTITDSDITGKTLILGTDYEVDYSDNINASTNAKATITGKGNYQGSFDVTYEITKRPISIKPNDLTVYYDGQSHTVEGNNWSYVDENGIKLVSGHNLSIVTNTITNVEQSKVNSNNTTSFSIVDGSNNDVKGNYDVNIETKGTLQINPIDDDVTINDDLSKTYDGNAVNNPSNITRNGNGTLSYKYYDVSKNELNGAPKDAGTYYVKAFEEASGNYIASESDYKEFRITPLAITITSSNGEWVYDGSTHKKEENNINIALPSNHSLTSLSYDSSIKDVKYDASGNVSSIQNAISNAVIKCGDNVVTQNFNITYTAGTLKVTPKDLSSNITVQVSDQTYNGTQLTPVPVVEYVVEESIKETLIKGSDFTIEYGENTYTTANASNNGSLTITAKEKGNYKGSIGATFTILQKSLTITANSAEKEFDNSALTNNGHTENGLVNNDKVTIITVNGSQLNVGESNNVASGAKINNADETKDVTECYAITYSPGTLKVKPATLNYTASGYTGVYDGKAHKINVSSSPIGEKASTIYYSENSNYSNKSTTEIEKTNAGTYTIYYEIVNDNYNTVRGSQTIVISQRPLTIEAKSDSKTYDGSPLTNEVAEIKGGTLADDHTATLTTSGTITNAGSTSNVPNIEIKDKDGIDVTRNYSIAKNNGTLTVNKATITVKANDHSITYGDDPSDNGVTYSGFKNDETSSVISGTPTYTYSYAKYRDVGNNYTITPVVTSLTATNYKFVPENGTLSVEQKEVSLNWSTTNSWVFNNQAHSTSVTVGGVVNNDQISATLNNNSITNVGSVEVRVSALTGNIANNYKLPTNATKTLTVTPATISETKAGYKGTYDATDHKISVTPNTIGSISSEIFYSERELNASNYNSYGSTDEISKTNAGEYTIYYYIVNANYNNKAGNAVIKIEKADQSINAEDLTVTFDGNKHKPQVTQSGVTNGTNVGTLTSKYKIKDSTNEFVSLDDGLINVGTYTIKYDAAETENYKPATKEVTLTINPKSIANDWLSLDNTSYTYDGNEKKPTLTVKDGTTTLVNGTDYEFSYENDTRNVGTKKITVTGKGNYTGTAEITYNITNATMTISAPDKTYTYNRSEQGEVITVTTVNSQTATIKYGTTSGTYNLDAAPTRTDVGTTTVYYKVTAPNHAERTGSYTITINAKPIANDWLSLDTTSYVYDGNSKKPTLTVTDKDNGSATLVNNTEYTFSYPTDTTNVETKTITVTGKGNYTGSAEITYNITNATITVDAPNQSYVYNQGAQGKAITVTTVNSQTATIKYGTTSGTYNKVSVHC